MVNLWAAFGEPGKKGCLNEEAAFVHLTQSHLNHLAVGKDPMEIGMHKKTSSMHSTWMMCGTPSGARTLDTLIKSQVLYQLS